MTNTTACVERSGSPATHYLNRLSDIITRIQTTRRACGMSSDPKLWRVALDAGEISEYEYRMKVQWDSFHDRIAAMSREQLKAWG